MSFFDNEEKSIILEQEKNVNDKLSEMKTKTLENMNNEHIFDIDNYYEKSVVSKVEGFTTKTDKELKDESWKYKYLMNEDEINNDYDNAQNEFYEKTIPKNTLSKYEKTRDVMEKSLNENIQSYLDQLEYTLNILEKGDLLTRYKGFVVSVDGQKYYLNKYGLKRKIVGGYISMLGREIELESFYKAQFDELREGLPLNTKYYMEEGGRYMFRNYSSINNYVYVSDKGELFFTRSDGFKYSSDEYKTKNYVNYDTVINTKRLFGMRWVKNTAYFRSNLHILKSKNIIEAYYNVYDKIQGKYIKKFITDEIKNDIRQYELKPFYKNYRSKYNSTIVIIFMEPDASLHNSLQVISSIDEIPEIKKTPTVKLASRLVGEEDIEELMKRRTVVVSNIDDMVSTLANRNNTMTSKADINYVEQLKKLRENIVDKARELSFNYEDLNHMKQLVTTLNNQNVDLTVQSTSFKYILYTVLVLSILVFSLFLYSFVNESEEMRLMSVVGIIGIFVVLCYYIYVKKMYKTIWNM